jgi:hypothetical protein
MVIHRNFLHRRAKNRLQTHSLQTTVEKRKSKVLFFGQKYVKTLLGWR